MGKFRKLISESFYIDLRSLALFRVSVGLVCLYDLIMASKVEYETEFELIFNEKDSKKFYTLDGRTTNQWLAKGLNDEAESPTKAEQMIQKGQDELDALFGENSSVDNKAKIMLLKSELQKIVKLVDEL